MNRFLTAVLMAVIAVGVVNAQVPKLNSYPAATNAVIFLDFDGQTITSAAWTGYTGGVPFYATPSTLTPDQITTVFNQVAEDFRPFNLNITTDSTVYFAAPINRRQRIVITNYSSWYGSAGGVAWPGTFREGMETPAFVFNNLLGNNPKNIAEACSHESGHTLGLLHQTRYNPDCTLFNNSWYNPGTGTVGTETSWAPIMGRSYSRTLSLWSDSTSEEGCGIRQNDLAIISGAANGFGFRTDDVGNTTAAAANINFTGNNYGISGFINSTNDIDIYRLTLAQRGRYILNAVPFNTASGYVSANIDLQVSLLNNSGVVIRTYNPTTSIQAIVDTVLNGGTYFIRVSNVANENTTNYGMLGNYSLSGSFTPGSALPVYGLSLTGTEANSKHELKWNIIADEPIESITIQTSADGTNFTQLQELGGGFRKFVYQPYEKGTVYYRLFVVTASQLKYYSNIISIRATGGGTKYSLLTNLISGSNAIAISSSNQYNWKLIDMNGRNISGGRLNTGMNRIQTTSLVNGMYLLQIFDGNQVTTEKLVKQ
jgi:hypothetical protein